MTNKYEVIESFITEAEANRVADYLYTFINKGTHENKTKTYVMHNRPDTWDPWGYIEKAATASDEYFRSRCKTGMLEPTRYFARRFEEGAEIVPFVEKATGKDAEVHEVYRKIAILVLDVRCLGCQTVFPGYDEVLNLKPGDLLMYEVGEENITGMTKIEGGDRTEVVMWYSEMVMKTRFDEFYMPPMENQSDRFDTSASV
jgi:hypothetical protein